jgi:hypothetical protein
VFGLGVLGEHNEPFLRNFRELSESSRRSQILFYFFEVFFIYNWTLCVKVCGTEVDGVYGLKHSAC